MNKTPRRAKNNRNSSIGAKFDETEVKNGKISPKNLGKVSLGCHASCHVYLTRQQAPVTRGSPWLAEAIHVSTVHVESTRKEADRAGSLQDPTKTRGSAWNADPTAQIRSGSGDKPIGV
ncbi:hypothetical protein PIB30_044264 [Stylosanthes scabra]|uniref:Uncharacterized protein n=1 Tax=Stylosanthes scabra TaxID=79078 RepID=A0ABU6RFU7_9FABA|nr:hypothetical protein [Stylosanthes scabra]